MHAADGVYYVHLADRAHLVDSANPADTVNLVHRGDGVHRTLRVHLVDGVRSSLPEFGVHRDHQADEAEGLEQVLHVHLVDPLRQIHAVHTPQLVDAM